MAMTRGDVVSTPLGRGFVNYVRYDHLAPAGAPMPIVAVSVILDSRFGDPGYSGTIFPAADVTRPGLIRVGGLDVIPGIGGGYD